MECVFREWCGCVCECESQETNKLERNVMEWESGERGKERDSELTTEMCEVRMSKSKRMKCTELKEL